MSRSKPYRDPPILMERRIKSLIRQMSLEEKVAQLGSILASDLINENGKFSKEKAKELIDNGIGPVSYTHLTLPTTERV